MHCQICDYSEHEGSPLLGSPPSRHNKVRYFKPWDGFYCSECISTVVSVIVEDKLEDEKKNECSLEGTPALPGV
jgi:hypothetical protein